MDGVVSGLIGLRASPIGTIPLGEVLPQPTVRKRTAILHVKGFVASIGAQCSPFFQVAIQQRRALAVLAIPCCVVPRKHQWFFEMGLYRCINGQADDVVKGGLLSSANYKRWPHYIPLNRVSLAELNQRIFLRVVKVRLVSDSTICFEGWIKGWAIVKAIVLGSCL